MAVWIGRNEIKGMRGLPAALGVSSGGEPRCIAGSWCGQFAHERSESGPPVIGGDEEQEDDCEDEHDAQDGAAELPAPSHARAGDHRRPRFQSSSRA